MIGSTSLEGGPVNNTVLERTDPQATSSANLSRRRRTVAVLVIAVLVVGAVSWYLLAEQRSRSNKAADVLDPQGSTGGIFWVDPQDEAAARSTADDFQEYSRTVPMRKGEAMAIVIIVTNDSDYPVTVRGSTAPDRVVVAAATEPENSEGGVVDWRERTYADDVTIAPGRWHQLRVEWTSKALCLGYGRGAGFDLSSFSVDTLVDGRRLSLMEPRTV